MTDEQSVSSQERRRDTISIPRQAAVIFGSLISGGLLLGAGAVFHLAGDLRGIPENERRIAELERWRERHEDFARHWIQRIIVCEQRANQCEKLLDRQGNLK